MTEAITTYAPMIIIGAVLILIGMILTYRANGRTPGGA